MAKKPRSQRRKQHQQPQQQTTKTTTTSLSTTRAAKHMTGNSIMGTNGGATGGGGGVGNYNDDDNNNNIDSDMFDHHYGHAVELSADDVNMDYLPEEHTISDSVTTGVSAFEEDDFLEDFETADNNHLDDALLAGIAGRSNPTAAAAAIASRMGRLQDALLPLDDLPTEKRSTRRELMLRRAFRGLAQYATGITGQTLVSNHATSIQTACFRSCSSIGQPAEQYAACRVLEAASVLVGSSSSSSNMDVTVDMDDWYEALDRPMRVCLMTKSRAPAVRGAALRALTMAVFMTNTQHDASIITEALMDLCESFAAETYRHEIIPINLRVTALECWALLGSLCSDFDLAGADDVQIGRGLAVLELLQSCLGQQQQHGAGGGSSSASNQMDLRLAAGVCLSLIHEARLNLGISAGRDDGADDSHHHGTKNQGENITARQYQRGSWDGTRWETIMDEVRQRIAELAVESGHHMSKRAKKEQRAAFREYMNTIVDDESPEEVIHFRGGSSIELHSWREIVQLDYFRHCLQGGFQAQLLTNNTLQSIFGANGRALNEVGTMSQLDKRLMMSKTSEAAKMADQSMTKRRDKRENIKNHFLTADGDDL